MSLVKFGMSAVGRLLVIVVLLGAFAGGLFGVVIFSLRGEEVQVPEIVGKDFISSEKELAALGLKIKNRATRYSQQAPNTVLEQSPRPGETVKTGIPIFVTISRAYTEGDEIPVEPEKPTDANTATVNDNEPVNTALTKKDKPKPKKTNANTNANSAKSSSTANTAAGSADNKSTGGSDAKPSNSDKKEPDTKPATTPKPQPAKTPAKAPAASGDTRNRRTP